jgi:hypothetical protein
MSKNIFVVTTETYCDGDYTLDIEGTFSNKLAAKKEMKLCAEDYIEEYEWRNGDYKRHDENNEIILKSTISSLEMRITIHKTTVDKSNFE